jgi:hypothetical protein
MQSGEYCSESERAEWPTALCGVSAFARRTTQREVLGARVFREHGERGTAHGGHPSVFRSARPTSPSQRAVEAPLLTTQPRHVWGGVDPEKTPMRRRSMGVFYLSINHLLVSQLRRLRLNTSMLLFRWTQRNSSLDPIPVPSPPPSYLSPDHPQSAIPLIDK